MKKQLQLIILGIMLVLLARPLAMAERGCAAIGGEYFLILAPWMIDELITSFKGIFSEDQYELVGEE